MSSLGPLPLSPSFSIVTAFKLETPSSTLLHGGGGRGGGGGAVRASAEGGRNQFVSRRFVGAQFRQLAITVSPSDRFTLTFQLSTTYPPLSSYASVMEHGRVVPSLCNHTPFEPYKNHAVLKLGISHTHR